MCEITDYQKEKADRVLSTLEIIFPDIRQGPKERCPICCETNLPCSECVQLSIAAHFNRTDTTKDVTDV